VAVDPVRVHFLDSSVLEQLRGKLASVASFHFVTGETLENRFERLVRQMSPDCHFRRLGMLRGEKQMKI
jgi:hypothetical protein